MNQSVQRPENLPDFKAPPLNEVVLGMQFAPPQSYQQILAGEVFRLFSKDYPIVQEQISLPSHFETFGLPYQPVVPQISFQTTHHDRFWFLRQDSEELIQFQLDRLMHNWRKVGDGRNEYPRFESMLTKFVLELRKLKDFLSSLQPQELEINQCEVSYINHIKFNRQAGEKISDWLSYINIPNHPEDFTFTFRETLRDEGGKPYARFYAEANTGYLTDGTEIILLSLSVKGAPKAPTIESGIDFLTMGREVIVRKFAELTTEKAHESWGRVK